MSCDLLMEDSVIFILQLRGRLPTSVVENVIRESCGKLGFVVKKEQMECALYCVRGQDVFVSLPTGSGKSLCYGMLPLVYDGLKNTLGITDGKRSIVIVISPLLSLMQDQVQKFCQMGLQAAYVGHDTKSETRDRIIAGFYQLVFISPEDCLREGVYRNMISSEVYQQQLCCIAVDEAHCVEKWYVCVSSTIVMVLFHDCFISFLGD